MSRTITLAGLVEEGNLVYGDGYRTKKAEHGRPGIPILRVAEVLDGSIRPEFKDFVSETHRAAMGNKVSQPGDVVLTTKGTVGRAAIMPALYDPFVYSPQLCFFRVSDNSSLSPHYLYYWFKSNEFWSQAASRKSQTDMADYLNLADIGSLRITLPGPVEQEEIVAVLGALDDKIAVGNRIAATCSELMRSHYKKAIAFDSRHVTLSELAIFANNQRVPLSSREREARPGPYPYHGAAGIIGHVDDFLFDGTRLLVGEDGTVITTEGRPVTQYVWGKFWVNNHAHVLTGTTISTEMLSIALHFTNVSSLITGAVQPKLSMSNLRRLEVPIPPADTLTELESRFAALHQRIRSARTETHKLIELRDALLPELMSGRLRVKDAKKVVEESR